MGQGKWSIAQITKDQTPAEISEKNRILSCGGVLAPNKDHQGLNIGPPRVYVKNSE